MGGAFDEVALVKVVGFDAAHEEFVDEGGLDGEGVVDAAQEDGLIAELDAGSREAREALAHFGGEFPGVIGVNGNEEGVVSR